MALGVTITQDYCSGTWTLANVQRLEWSCGRQNFLDQYSPASCSIYGRRPDLLGGTPAIGDFLTISVAEGGQSARFAGVVADYRVIYGTTSTYDTWELRLDGAFSYITRTYATIATSAATTTKTMADSIVTAAPATTVAAIAGGWGSTTSAQSLVDVLGSTLQMLMVTEQGWIQELPYTGSPNTAYMYLYGRNTAVATTYTFADDGTAGAYKYTEIEFRGSADNYSTKVIVSAAGFADQSSGTGNYQVNVDTINGSATEAADLAGYIKTSMNLNQTVPFAIRCSGALNQATPAAIGVAATSSLGNGAVIKFRSSTYNCRIIGVDFSADTTDWQATLYLTSSLATAWLILDSTTNGILDTNKLGF